MQGKQTTNNPSLLSIDFTALSADNVAIQAACLIARGAVEDDDSPLAVAAGAQVEREAKNDADAP